MASEPSPGRIREQTNEVATALTPFEEVWPRVAARVRPLGSESLALVEADGRVLRSPVHARWDLPRADNSAMDGFAVRAEDTAAAPVTLRLARGTAYAGVPTQARIEPGTAIAIGTGGLLPLGADAVIPKENARRSDVGVEVLVAARRGEYIRYRGGELRAGDLVVAPGVILDPLRIAAAAMGGETVVEVARRPVVRVHTSGDEVVPLGVHPETGQMVDCNGPFLRRALAPLVGVEVETPPAIPDDRHALARALDGALEGSDVVIVTGGVSVGDRDLVKQVLEQDLGVERIVWRVAQKPGKPTYVGLRDRTWVLGLPGNPAAVAAMWFVLARPLLLALQGVVNPAPTRFAVRLAAAVQPSQVRTCLRWCRGVWDADCMKAEPLIRDASHMLSDFAAADLLVMVPAGDDLLPAGTILEAIRLER
jgi:molybdopterin molybdotransferase